MFSKIKSMVVGVVIGAVISGTMALGANTVTLYNVIADGVKIIVDGQKLNPKDANGNRVEPIIYNGTTYLPVRAVADALGKEVYWDGPNYTVYLGSMGGTLQYPSLYLEDATNIGGHTVEANVLTDNYGNSYDRAVKFYESWELEYLLDMKYTRFKGTLYVPKGENTSYTGRLKLIADGKIIYTSPEISETSRPVNIDVNITGCNDLKIEYDSGGFYSSITACLADCGFYQ